jgi:hypothetical protein
MSAFTREIYDEMIGLIGDATHAVGVGAFHTLFGPNQCPVIHDFRLVPGHRLQMTTTRSLPQSLDDGFAERFGVGIPDRQVSIRLLMPRAHAHSREVTTMILTMIQKDADAPAASHHLLGSLQLLAASFGAAQAEALRRSILSATDLRVHAVSVLNSLRQLNFLAK